MKSFLSKIQLFSKIIFLGKWTWCNKSFKYCIKIKKKISILIEIDERLKTGRKVHSLLRKNKFKLKSYEFNNSIYSKK